MDRYLKEIVEVLMRVIEGGEVSPAELAELSFLMESELRAVLLDAYVDLLEFAQHRDLRRGDAAADRAMRAQLMTSLKRIGELCVRGSPPPRPSASIH